MRYVRLSIMLLTAMSGGAAAQQVRFTGQTTADQTLIRDALQTILRYGDALQQCTTLSAVEARVLPAEYRPRNTQYHVANRQVSYERWDALLCGRSTAFLIGFWPSPEGGTMFQVSYPVPDDIPEEQGR